MTKYEGTVYDQFGNPVKGCHVTVLACYPRDGRSQCSTFTWGETTTDESGHFKMKEKSARSDRYTVIASAPGVGYYYKDGLPKEIRLD